jgi:2-polyprenyl-3-methyl-5-hydroxy-6-metoxy-1,4-benzoquinol methylase
MQGRKATPWWPDLARKVYHAELMDALDSDARQLRRTLRQFPLLNNALSRTRFLLERYVVSDIQRRQLQHVRILDVGAGGGDIARYLVRRLERVAGVQLSVDCCEADPRVAAFARRACSRFDAIRVLERSVFDLDGPPYDYIINNHFLHHLREEHLTAFLNLTRKLCSGCMLCNDLERSRSSYLAYRALAPILLRDSFAAYDGALSIRRAYVVPELKQLVAHSSWAGSARVGRLEPGRVFILGRAAGITA